jgi:hypothetical protein
MSLVTILETCHASAAVVTDDALLVAVGTVIAVVVGIVAVAEDVGFAVEGTAPMVAAEDVGVGQAAGMVDSHRRHCHHYDRDPSSRRVGGWVGVGEGGRKNEMVVIDLACS